MKNTHYSVWLSRAAVGCTLAIVPLAVAKLLIAVGVMFMVGLTFGVAGLLTSPDLRGRGVVS